MDTIYDSSIIDTSLLTSYLWVGVVVAIIMLIAWWMIFAKAGQAGWKAIIPFYSQYTLTKIAFGNGWIFLLMFVPIANLVYMILLAGKLAKAFGKGGGFAVGLFFLPFIFYLILAFGSAEYKGVEE